MRKLAVAGLSALVLPAEAGRADPGYSPAELSLVTALFTVLQPRSVASDAEFCGYIYRDVAGWLRASGPVEGDEETCTAPWPESGTPLASWHTHAGYDLDMWNEVPSARDVQADSFEGVDGWVATPGGRLWHIDGEAMRATLICGPSCLPADPAYDAEATGEIGWRYSFDDLLDKFAGE